MKDGEWIVIDSREYQLDTVLSTGVGSYGQVWAAMDDAGRAVALKFINTEAMSQADPSLRGHWRAHLEREITFLASLSAEQSRHIVTLLDHGQMDGQPVLVLERLAANLGQWLAQQRRDNAPPPDLERILDWAEQILTGLEVIHHAGFVYRDLKFSNILVDQRGEQLKLADFGSLKRENGDSTRSFIGTPATMAPEQALPVRFGPEGGEYVVDHRADYYALGLLLFGLFTRQPATAAQRRLGQLLAQHGQEGAAQHGEQLGGLNDEERELLRQSIEFWTVPVLTLPGNGAAARLTELIDRLLARDPAERPQNSAEIRKILNEVRLGQAEPLTLAPTSDTPAIVADWDLPPPPTLPPNRHRRRAGTMNRSPWLHRAAALAGMMGLAGALAWAIVIRPTGELPQNHPIVPDAVITTTPVTVKPAPVAPIDVPPPAPESPVASEQPVADSEIAPVVAPETAPVVDSQPVVEPETAPVVNSQPVSEPETAPVVDSQPAVEPETAPVVDSGSQLSSNPVTVEIAEPPAAPPAVPSIAKPEPKTPAAPPAAPSIAKPEPKTPVAPRPEISRRPPLRTVKVAPPPLRDKPVPPVRTQRTVKATPSLPSATTRPATVVPASPVARAEPRLRTSPPTLPPIRLESRPQPESTPPTLPPIRLESRPQPKPTPPTLPPINLVSRTAPAPTTPPVRPAQTTNTPKSPPPVARTKPPAPRPTDPVTQFQEDAARASAGIRRDVEALTSWMGRTGASVGTEIQRGLNDADQAVTRWTRGNGTQVERRDRWSERHGDQTRHP